ncbi:MAG: hypothetical protein HeimC2_40570 [Candidatus Heimdallarchaeota archaeon LC_2]|nr:MAG: hypothetical protein HeimC2_40570 [Candidatus Heimdallarchaeota archaeon LC_2]
MTSDCDIFGVITPESSKFMIFFRVFNNSPQINHLKNHSQHRLKYNRG